MYKTITIKIGSNVLTTPEGILNEKRIAHLVDQMAYLKQRGVNILLVSSGAVAAGRKIVPCERPDPVASRQLWASVGQVKLIQLYSELLGKHGMLCSQVLVTKEDFRDRQHFLNIRSCLETLLEHDILPIINENDVVSVTELMFTDNDELAGLITSMMDAEAMIILSNVDGIFDGNPEDTNSKVIPVIENDFIGITRFISTKKSDFGRGGMMTKYGMAKKVAMSGTPVHLANGRRENILIDILESNPGLIQTFFSPGKKSTPIKKWLAYSDLSSKGEVYINEGARNILLSHKATSLLLIGVTQIKGDFMKGDIVKLIDHEGNLLGLGRSQYNSETAIKKIGEKNAKPIIHYDYLYLKV
ncbi:MAG: glutamate 5-kinase [Bacteroidota bacterium]|nr:glutamate 5-kinase [Bacteroidota bacterium]